MNVSTDSLIAALLDQRFHLAGQNGGVSLYCRDCTSLVGFYSRKGAIHADPETVNVTTAAGLWAQAVDHLADAHRETASLPLPGGRP